MAPPDDSLSLEFRYADLKLKGKTEANTVVEAIHEHVTTVAGLREDSIVLVQPMPSQFWTQKFVIYCANETTKNTLMQRGLDIFRTHVDLEEPGSGIQRIEIQNAPGSMPGNIIKDWLQQYGTIVGFDYEKYRFKSGTRTTWLTGTRVAYMKQMKGQLPPVKTLRWEAKQKDVQIRIWYFGQSDTYCRFCKQTVPKAHKCDLAPKKVCYGCGGEGHFIQNCTNPKQTDDAATKANPTNASLLRSDSQASKPFKPPIIYASSLPNVQKGKVLQSTSAPNDDDNSYGAPSDSDSNFRPQASKKALDPMSIPGKKPTRRMRKAKRVRGGKQTPGGEWLSGEESAGESESSQANKKPKKSKSSPKKGIPSYFKVNDFDEYKSAISDSEDEMSENEGMDEEGKNRPKISVTTPTDEESADEEKDPEPVKEKPDENPLTKEKDVVKDEEEVIIDDSGVDEIERYRDQPLSDATENITTGESKEAQRQIQEYEYDEWSRQQSMEVSEPILPNEVGKTAPLIDLNDLAPPTAAGDPEPGIYDDNIQLNAEVLVFGGSNSRDTVRCFVDTENLKIKATNLCVGGQRIASTTNKIHDLDDEYKKKVNIAIIHVGSVDFPCSEEEADHKLESYKQEVKVIHKECPGADIIMSGIIPRFGESEKVIETNLQLDKFNGKLDGLKETNMKFYYINNSFLFVDGTLRKDLYRLNDRDGIHLSLKGQEKMAQTWQNEVARLCHIQHMKRVSSLDVFVNDESPETLPTQL